MTRVAISVFSAAMVVFQAGVATGQTTSTGSGQAYPNRPIRMVTTAPGGGNDFTARVIAQGLTASLGQQVIVDNRTSSVVPGDIVAKAPPDGYVLMLGGSTFFIGPLLEKAPYDPVRDFAPITLATRVPNVIVVHPSVPVNSVAELIAYAKSKPGELNYGASGVGSSGHLAAELLKSMAGINIVNIHYKGSAPALNAMIGGEVQLMFTMLPPVAPHIKSRRLKALAVASAQPSTLAPGLPTVAASGLPGYESVTMTGIFAPAKTPATLINRLNQDVVRVLNQADVKEKFLNAGSEVAASSPQELAAAIKSEIARMGKVIKDAGIRTE